MGILPGGTGNGFAREMGVPGTLREATTVLCTSSNTRAIDVGRLVDVAQAPVADRWFIQRLYIGVEPEQQTSRELKDKYGVFAYAVSLAGRATGGNRSRYVADLDGEHFEFEASTIYVVNSGMMGTGLKITHTYAVDDGLLDCFALDRPEPRQRCRGRRPAARHPRLERGALLPPGAGRIAPGRARSAGLDGRRVRRADAGQDRSRSDRP